MWKRTFFFSDIAPISSIVIPVFNQEQIISRILDSLIENLTLPTQLIILVDRSRDFSEQRVLEFFEKMSETSSVRNYSKLVSVDLVISSKTLFETKADNIGFALALGEYVIEIQSDMLIIDPGFDAKLISCLQQNLDLFAVSGRAITSLSAVNNSEFQRRAKPFSYALKQLLLRFNRRSKENLTPTSMGFTDRLFPTEEIFKVSGLAGWRGNLIDDYSTDPNLIPAEVKDLDSRPLYVGEIVMRGPLCFRKSELVALGYLNQDAFFLGYDEIDLCLRAWKFLGKRVGFMPVYLFSPAEWGSTRKRKSFTSRVLLWLRFVVYSKRFRHSLAFELISSPNLQMQTSKNIEKELRRTIPNG